MSLWVFIWLLISIALIYFSVWTIWIVLKQKRSWSRFAERYKLRYSSPSLFMPPKVSGVYEGYPIMMFPCEHMLPDARGTRKLMAIEVEMGSRMPVGGAAGSGGMVSVVQELDFPHESVPSVKWWDPSYIVRSEERNFMDAYLTVPRLKALMALAKIKNAWMIFVFRGNTTILRMDTPDPLDSEEKIRKVLHKMIEVAKVLELEDGEAKKLVSASVQKPKGKALPVKGKDLDAPVGLELEEDEGKPGGEPSVQDEDNGGDEAGKAE